jgi:hypothetical protein
MKRSGRYPKRVSAVLGVLALVAVGAVRPGSAGAAGAPTLADGNYRMSFAWAGQYTNATSRSTYDVSAFGVGDLVVSAGVIAGSWHVGGGGTVTTPRANGSVTYDGGGDIRGASGVPTLFGNVTVAGSATTPSGASASINQTRAVGVTGSGEGIPVNILAATPNRADGDWTFAQTSFLESAGFNVSGSGSWVAIRVGARGSRLPARTQRVLDDANTTFASGTLPDAQQLSDLLARVDKVAPSLPAARGDRLSGGHFVGPLAVGTQSLLQRALAAPDMSSAELVSVVTAAYHEGAIGAGSVLPGADALEAAVQAEVARRIDAAPDDATRLFLGIVARQFAWPGAPSRSSLKVAKVSAPSPANTLAVTAVKHAATYRFVVLDRNGHAYWASEGTRRVTATPTRGSSGPSIGKRGSVRVSAFDSSGAPLASS